MSTGALPAEPVARVVAFYETLTPDSLGRLGEVYAVNARFKDPFNEVTGLAPIEAIFRAMCPDLPMPLTMTLPVQRRIKSSASEKWWSSLRASRATAAASISSTRRASVSALDLAGRATRGFLARETAIIIQP